MARNRRSFLLKDYDEVRRFNEQVAGWNTRDAGGLPLGNVQAHAEHRLNTCYQILKAAELARRFGHIDSSSAFQAVGAAVQDKKGTREYPAAHLAPCGLLVSTARTGSRTGPRGQPGPGNFRQFHNIFADGITVSFVQNLFGATENVHKFVNHADSQMERAKTGDGFVAVLVDCCAAIARSGETTARGLLADRLVPEFKALAADYLVELHSGGPADPGTSALLDGTGRPFGWTPPANQLPGLLDRYGRPAQERPADISVNSADPQALLYNRRALEMIYGLYAGVNAPQASQLSRLDFPFAALEQNELRAATA